jgi:hypothetical protein
MILLCIQPNINISQDVRQCNEDWSYFLDLKNFKVQSTVHLTNIP